MAQIMADLGDADAVMCSCSTLGPLVEQACQSGQDVLVALCLDSTLDATVDLLKQCAAEAGIDVSVRVVLCSKAWPLFEAGDLVGFSHAISEQIRDEVTLGGVPDSIVLAQASMAGAGTLLKDVGCLVLSSPLLAARRAVEIAQGGAKTPE